ncbi:MAG: PD-(D/E)XK nuclease family transposase [Allobaculum sp.]|nr:PD-(D/E)XK nuclease family transposase [Allobaculum sp.]
MTIEKSLKKGILKVLNVWNDFYARVFLDGNTAVVTDMINAALEKEDIRIVEMRTQEQKNDLKTKNIIFDGLAIDNKGKVYAIEIQNRHEIGFEERLAYESAVLIKMTLESGQKYKDRPESTLIAFCKFKPRGVSTDQVIYNIGRVFLETGERFPDNEKIVMVNGSQIPNLDTPIGKVIHDMYEESAENMLLDSFKKTTHELKETKEGAEKMGEIQQMIYDQGDANGFVRGKEEGLIESISVLIQNGFPIEDIKRMYGSKYSEEDLQKVLSKAQLLVA